MKKWIILLLVLLLTVGSAQAGTVWSVPLSDPEGAPWTHQDMPDVVKTNPGQHETCWLAAAANVLGAAGWGQFQDPNYLNLTPQQRAEHIYNNMTADQGFGAGNPVVAIRDWMRDHGHNRDDISYDPDNLWWWVTPMRGSALGGNMIRSQYDTLRSNMAQGFYVDVVFDLAGGGFHAVTAVGLDASSDNPSESTWHNSNGQDLNPPAGSHDTTENHFAQNDPKTWWIDSPQGDQIPWYSRWAITLHPHLAGGDDPIPAKPFEAVDNFDVAYYADLDGMGDQFGAFEVTGDNAGVYTGPNDELEPFWQDNHTVVIPNEPQIEMQKEIYLLIEYAEVQGGGDPGILVEDPWGGQFNPVEIDWSLDGTIVLLQWTLEDQQPPYEKIIFPDNDYKELYDITTDDGSVFGWNLATLCVPEPATPKNRGDVTEDLPDGFVGADDLVRILSHWGESGPAVGWSDGDCAPYNDGITTGNKFVGADDYVEVLSVWGTSYPAEPTPEPATLGLLLISGLVLLKRRK